jgi:membrane-associated protease RseP (regulator of RpoE activity)
MFLSSHRSPWGRWLLASAAALGLAVFGLVRGVADEPKKEEPKKEPKRERKLDFPDLEKLFEDLPGLDREQMEAFRKHMEEMRRALEARGLRPGMRLPGLFDRLEAREGRLGALVGKPDATLVEQLDLPKDQGLVVVEVQPGSAAEKAGLKPHDVLLELDGKAVPNNPEELARQLAALKPGAKVDVLVLRKGKKETVKGLELPEAKPARGRKLDVAAPGEKGVVTTVNRTNDRFTASRQEGDVTVSVSGRVADGKAVAEEIEVKDGKETKKYAEVDKVPEAYRGQVKQLLEQSSGNGLRIERNRF